MQNNKVDQNKVISLQELEKVQEAITKFTRSSEDNILSDLQLMFNCTMTSDLDLDLDIRKRVSESHEDISTLINDVLSISKA